MQTEPQEIRLRRTARCEAVRLAARLVHGARKNDAPGAVDEAFADLAETPTKPVSVRPIDTAQIAEQLKQLDQQRARLASLLSDLDPS